MQGDPGDDGSPGPPGTNGLPGMVYRGAWTANTFYAVGDVMSHASTIFIANVNHTSASSFSTPPPTTLDILVPAPASGMDLTIATDQSAADSVNFVSATFSAGAGTIPLGPNEWWKGTLVLEHDSDQTSDIKIKFNGPSGCTFVANCRGEGSNSANDASGVKFGRVTDFTTNVPFGGLHGAANGDITSIIIELRIKNGTTAGNFDVLFARNTTGGTAGAIVKNTSWGTLGREA